MPPKKNRRRKKQVAVQKKGIIYFFRSERGHFLIGVCLLFISLYAIIGMISFFFTGAADQSKVVNKYFLDLITHKQEIDNWTGVGGAFIAEGLINKYFGISAFIIPIFIIIVGIRLMGVKRISLARTFLISAFLLIWGSIFSSFLLSRAFAESHIIWGGSHGQVLERLMENTIGVIGVFLVLILLLAIIIIVTKQTSVVFFRKALQPSRTNKTTDSYDLYEDESDNERTGVIPAFFNKIISLFKRITNNKNEDDDIAAGERYLPEGNTTVQIVQPRTRAPRARKPEAPIQIEDDFEIVVPEGDAYEKQVARNLPPAPVATNASVPVTDVNIDGEEMEDYDPTKDLSHFHFPSTSLLKIYDTGGRGVDLDEQRANKEKIITTLRNYGIEITSIKATVGPTITLYEIVPQAGVRISKIRNLEDDIALSLSALGIRIIAPMPGKGTIGIEVPNKDPQIVSMQSVISSTRFQECKYDLPVALGKTITNEIFMFDLCKMPHLLVAGATGQGKSVGLNAIITSLLYKKHPAEMKMVLVDPKMVEFNIYSTIEKHYLAKLPDAEKAIITDVTKVTQTLNSLTKEMDDRYELLMAANVRTIKEYNEKFRKRRLNPLKGHRFLPYIVVIIDEFGDLIMTAGKEIEMPIARIAQKARAVGMHMIIATQRPTTNIITGTIKANFPARMAFRVTSQIDSRTILDMSGANQLIGRGDMLFSQGSDLVRIQCAFVDTPEVEGITQYISNQQGYASAFELPEYVGDGNGDDKPGAVDLSDRDPLFEEAARLIVVHQQGSTSLIQRKFSIGYNRAGRLMDQLEAANIVGPTQGSKPRDVLIADEYSLEQKLQSIQ